MGHCSSESLHSCLLNKLTLSSSTNMGNLQVGALMSLVNSFSATKAYKLIPDDMSWGEREA